MTGIIKYSLDVDTHQSRINVTIYHARYGQADDKCVSYDL